MSMLACGIVPSGFEQSTYSLSGEKSLELLRQIEFLGLGVGTTWSELQGFGGPFRQPRVPE